MFATPAGDIPFFEGSLMSATSFSLSLSLCLVGSALCPFSVCGEEWGVWQRVRGIQEEVLGRKEGSGLSGPLGCLLKSGSGSVVYSSFVGLSSGHLAQVNLRRLHP